MPYIGNQHNVGDHVNNFKVLDDISSHTATFDGSASSVISTTDETIRIPEHRFIQGQRVTYNNGGGGNIGGLTSGTAYFVTFDTPNTIKLATTLSNANSNTNINLSSVGSGTSHTLNAAFDNVNTKFKITYNSGTPARLNNATQLNIAINNVIQRPNQNVLTFTEGFAIEDGHKIVFKNAPTSNDIFWGSIIANTIENFDLRDNEVDNFTGDGSTTEFTLSTIPANNESVIVSLDGVLQHPSDKDTARSYTLIDSIIQFTAAPGNGVEIQVRHIGFAGASTADVSGFYGRTGNVVLTDQDDITVNKINVGTGVTIESNGQATFVGVVTFGSGSTTIDNNVVNVGTALTLGHTQGLQFHTQNLHSAGFEINQINASGIITASSLDISGNASIGGVLTYEDVTNIDSIGIITARAAVSIADSIVHTGDTNTSLRFPSADTITAETGGLERLRIDSSGRVLIGTTTEGHANADDLTIATSGTGGITIRTGTSNSGSIYFSDATSGTAEYAGFVGYSHANNSMIFGTNGAEKLRIMSNGYFGFGINSPSRRIHVHTSGSGSDYMQFTNDTTGTTSGDGYVFGISGDEDVIHNNLEATNMRFYTSGAERLRIDSSGRLLLGTTTAGYGEGDDLTIATSGHTGITIKGGTSNDCNIYFADGTSGNAQHQGIIQYRHSHDALRFFTNATERLRINSAGISTFYNSQLHIEGAGSGNTPLTINTDVASNNSVHPLVEAYSDNATYKTQIGLVREGSSGNLGWAFFTNAVGSPTERLRISSTGLVGIGTIANWSPYKLQVAGTLGIAESSNIGQQAMSITNNAIQTLAIGVAYNALSLNKDGGNVGIGVENPSHLLHLKSASTPSIKLEDTTNTNILLVYAQDSNSHVGTYSNHPLIFDTNSTERLRITSDGKVGINQASPSTKLEVGGGSILVDAFNTSGDHGIFFRRGFNSTSSPYNVSILAYDHSGSSKDGLSINGYDGISFCTGSNTRAEKLRITSAGCVNIGGDYTQQDDRLSILAGSGFEAIGIGGTTKGIRFGWDGDRTAYDDIRMYRVDYSNSGTYGIGGNSPCFVMTPTSAPGSGIVQETVWLKSTGRGSGNNEMNLMVDGDVVIGGDGQVPGSSESGYPSSLVSGLGYSKLTIQSDDRTTAFSASDGTTWHDVILKQSGSATSNAIGIAFEVSANAYHHNAGTGIAAIKDGNSSDYGCDLAFITRPHSAVAEERMRIRSKGGLRLNNTSSNEVHAISNYDHGNHDYSHRNNRVLTSNGTGWDGNDSTDGADPILILSVADRAGNSDIGDAYGLCLHSDSQDNNDYGPLIGWSNRSNSGAYNTTYAAIVGQKTGQATDANWSSGALHFFTNKPGAGGYMNNVADLAIDEDGKVTMPRQPAFRATESAHAQTGLITFDQIVTNIGGHYNGSNGRFTAPVAGTYYFTFYGMAGSSSGNLRVEFYINGSAHSSGEHYGGVAYAHGGTYSHISCSTILTLAANDYVNLHWNPSYNNLHSYHNGFMGYLIG